MFTLVHKFLNTASDLTNAFVGEGICANDGGNMSDLQGLQCKCNTNNSNGIMMPRAVPWPRKS